MEMTDKKFIHKIRGRIAVKLSLWISVVLAVIFTVIIAITAGLTGSRLSTVIQNEISLLAQKNAVSLQGVFDSVDSTAREVTEFINSKHGEENSTASSAGQMQADAQDILKSQLYGVSYSEASYEMEVSMRNIFETMTAGNEAIQNMGVTFEPYAFHKNIKDFSMLSQSSVDNGTVASYGDYNTYSSELFYTMVKGSDIPIVTPAYEWNGDNLITIAYPITEQGKFVGATFSDINISYLSQSLVPSDEYKTLENTVMTSDGTIIYTSDSTKSTGADALEDFSNYQEQK